MIRHPLRIAASALAATVSLIPAAAPAQSGGYGYGPGGYGGRYGYDRGYYPSPPPPAYVGRNYPPGGYVAGGYRDAGYGDRAYRRRARGYCRDKGTGGTIIGAIAGGLLGNGIAGRGDRGAGTIIGAGVGALAGRAIDRNC